MTEKTSGSSAHHLPPCPQSSQCIRMLDELTFLEQSTGDAATSILPDPLEHQDALSLEQLLAHLHACPTCSAAVARVRDELAWQRRGLRDVLAEGELKVPTTSALIMASIRREQSQQAHSTTETQDIFHELSPLSFPEVHSHMGTQRRRVAGTRFLLTIVAALLLLVPVGLFARFLALRTQTTTLTSSPVHAPTLTPAPGLPAAVSKSANWSSVILTARSADGSKQIIENYNPINGKSVQLLPSCCTNAVQFDSIAHSGYNLIYHTFDGQDTHYSFLIGPTFTIQGQGSNAVWSTTDQFVYLDTPQGGLQVDVRHGTQKKLPAFAYTRRLAFARDLGQESFLYLIRTQADGSRDLYRLNVATGLQNLVASGASSANFWSDPTGAVVYYTKIVAGQSVIYTTKSDGSGRALAFHLNAIPVGYASDGALMIISQQQAAFKLLKVGIVDQQDVTVLDTIVPGADALCDTSVPVGTMPVCGSSIALAPLGDMLVVEAGYANGNHKLWSIDLQLSAGKTTQLQLPSGLSHIQLLGWAKFLLN